MFYKMITKKRDEWFDGDCPVKALVAYMEATSQLRDAQIDAIKTYLFLKIACANKPLYTLFLKVLLTRSIWTSLKFPRQQETLLNQILPLPLYTNTPL